MIRLIAAIDRKFGIAKNGFQPWYIPDDENYFTRETQQYGGIVLIGSTTYKTLKGPLPGRTNFVLTSDKSPIDGVELVHNLDKFLKDFQNKDVWVVGGANVFTQVLQSGKADELFLTRIEADFGCNQFFPEFDTTHTLRDQSELHEQNGFLYTYEVYVKK